MTESYTSTKVTLWVFLMIFCSLNANSQKVYDYAQVLSTSQKQKLTSTIKLLKRKSSISFDVVTTRETNGFNLKSFLLKTNRIDSLESYEIVLLIDVNSLKAMLFSHGLAQENEQIVLSIMNRVVINIIDPELSEQKFYEAIFKGIRALHQVWRKYYYEDIQKERTALVAIWIFLMALAFGLIYIYRSIILNWKDHVKAYREIMERERLFGDKGPLTGEIHLWLLID